MNKYQVNNHRAKAIAAVPAHSRRYTIDVSVDGSWDETGKAGTGVVVHKEQSLPEYQGELMKRAIPPIQIEASGCFNNTSICGAC